MNIYSHSCVALDLHGDLFVGQCFCFRNEPSYMGLKHQFRDPAVLLASTGAMGEMRLGFVFFLKIIS